jgi:hypothetical protein
MRRNIVKHAQPVTRLLRLRSPGIKVEADLELSSSGSQCLVEIFEHEVEGVNGERTMTIFVVEYSLLIFNEQYTGDAIVLGHFQLENAHSPRDGG